MIEKLNLPRYVKGLPKDEDDACIYGSTLQIEQKLNEVIDRINIHDKEHYGCCKHDWEYSSPPHRDQRCKKCGEHRIEPPDPEPQGWFVLNSKPRLEEVITKAIDLTDDSKDLEKRIVPAVRAWINAQLTEEFCGKSVYGQGWLACLKEVRERLC